MYIDVNIMCVCVCVCVCVHARAFLRIPWTLLSHTGLMLTKLHGVTYQNLNSATPTSNTFQCFIVCL